MDELDRGAVTGPIFTDPDSVCDMLTGAEVGLVVAANDAEHALIAKLSAESRTAWLQG